MQKPDTAAKNQPAFGSWSFLTLALPTRVVWCFCSVSTSWSKRGRNSLISRRSDTFFRSPNSDQWRVTSVIPQWDNLYKKTSQATKFYQVRCLSRQRAKYKELAQVSAEDWKIEVFVLTSCRRKFHSIDMNFQWNKPAAHTSAVSSVQSAVLQGATARMKRARQTINILKWSLPCRHFLDIHINSSLRRVGIRAGADTHTVEFIQARKGFHERTVRGLIWGGRGSEQSYRQYTRTHSPSFHPSLAFLKLMAYRVKNAEFKIYLIRRPKHNEKVLCVS